MIMKKILILLTGLIILSYYGCQKYDKPDVKYTATFPLNGEWWATLRDINGNVLVDYKKLETYNTAANTPDSIWVTDLGNLWNFQVKIACNVPKKTFGQVDSVPNVSYPINVKIIDGIVVLKGGLTKGGNVSDSIYMKIGFTDDPGTTYIISGVRRTGFVEDEY